MKRLILLSCALFAVAMSWAEIVLPADFKVHLKDGTSSVTFLGSETEMTFNADGTVLTISNPNTPFMASYAVDGIDSIEFFEHNGTAGGGSLETPVVDVAIDPTDDTSYSEVEEEVITDDTHDDYGDFIENYTPKNRVTVTYDGDKATVTGTVSGVTAKVTGAHVLITSSKKNIAYTLKGATTDGSFKLYSTNKTQITLDGVSITNPKGAAVNIQSGKTMLVELADGTVNSLTDGATYTMATGEDQKGTLFSEGQLVFSGDGSLDVKSNYGHGIVSDDYIRVRGGNITVNSVRDGINTNDRFIMYGGTVTVDAHQDGLDVGKGYVEIGGGKLTVNAVDEGITASYEGDDAGNIDPLITPYIYIKGGLVKVATTGDKGHGLRAMSAFTMSGGIVQTTVKGAGSKALLSEGDMSLAGGKVTVFTEGDALYEEDVKDLSSSAGIRSKGALKIENMTVGIKSTGAGAKGINNVGGVTIKNSTVTVVAEGETHKYNNLDSRSRGVTTDGNFVLDGGALEVSSSDEPLRVLGSQAFLNAAIYSGYQMK